jgi:hypothetical protein
LDYNNRCPVCRTVVFLAPNHAVNSVIKNLAANTFPKGALPPALLRS